MEYTKVEVSRDDVREALLGFLRENQAQMHLVEPVEHPDHTAEIVWRDTPTRIGRNTNALVEEVFNRLNASGKLISTRVTVHDSSVMHVRGGYYPASIRAIILEEITRLIRMGVLMEGRFVTRNQQIYDFIPQREVNCVLLTDFGVRYVMNAQTVPYEASQYLAWLRRTAPPDEELEAYLSEGLACLEHHLARAAAVLLRLAAEHILDLLSDTILSKLPDENRRDGFRKKHNAARNSNNIEQRANVIFTTLDSDPLFVANNRHLQSRLNNELKPGFHGIRELGGGAAHLRTAIDLEQVRSYYHQFAEQVYKISMQIIAQINNANTP